MQVFRRADVLADPTPVPEPERFTGAAFSSGLQAARAVSRSSTAAIRLDLGVRGHWHKHSEGQIVHVVDGRGLLGRRDGEPLALEPGDTVWIEPDEEHWHGAADDEHVAHLAVSYGAITWLEPSR
jgi:quercetin dioxygenase-like cupin family protein